MFIAGDEVHRLDDAAAAGVGDEPVLGTTLFGIGDVSLAWDAVSVGAIRRELTLSRAWPVTEERDPPNFGFVGNKLFWAVIIKMIMSDKKNTLSDISRTYRISHNNQNRSQGWQQL